MGIEVVTFAICRNTITFSSQYPDFNIDLPGQRTESKGGVKGDFQFNSRKRLAVRWNKYQNLIPNSGGGASNHPSTSSANNRHAKQIFATYTQVLSTKTVNQIKGGINENFYTLEPVAGYSTTTNRRPPGTPEVFEGVYSGRAIRGGTPRINFAGYSIGSAANTPQRRQRSRDLVLSISEHRLPLARSTIFFGRSVHPRPPYHTDLLKRIVVGNGRYSSL